MCVGLVAIVFFCFRRFVKGFLLLLVSCWILSLSPYVQKCVLAGTSRRYFQKYPNPATSSAVFPTATSRWFKRKRKVTFLGLCELTKGYLHACLEVEGKTQLRKQKYKCSTELEQSAFIKMWKISEKGHFYSFWHLHGGFKMIQFCNICRRIWVFFAQI